MVERVVKLWSLMGSWWRSEEEEGGKDGVMVVVVGMEEKMKERMMVEFVVKIKGKWWRIGWPKEGAPWLRLLPCSLETKRRREEKNEWKREKEWGIYIYKGNNIIS